MQDLFLSETAALADVVFPVASLAEKNGTFTNTERRVQSIRPAVRPPGEARPDWQVACDLSSAMGYEMRYGSTAETMAEIAALIPTYAGTLHERLDNGGLQWSCLDENHPGTHFPYADGFPTATGRATF